MFPPSLHFTCRNPPFSNDNYMHLNNIFPNRSMIIRKRGNT